MSMHARSLQRRVTRVAVAASLALALGLSACGGSNSKSDTAATGSSAAGNSGKALQEIRVAVAPGSFLDLAPWLADEQGFFKSHGLKVTATIPTIPFSQLPSALGRTYDIILGTQPDLITAGSQGLDLVAVGGVNLDGERIPGAALAVSPKSGIKSFSDMAGKSVGAPSISGNNWLTLQCAVQKAGADPHAIRGVEAPAPAIAGLLQKGRFDSALLFQPLLGGALATGAKNIGDTYKACFDKPMYTSLWLSNGKWARSHSDAIKSFLAGLNEAKQYMIDHPDAARALYIKKSGLPPVVAKKAPIDPSVFAFRPIAVSDLQPWLDLMKKLSGFNRNVDLQKLVLE